MRRIATQQSRKIETLRACRYFQDVNHTILVEISQGMQLCRYEGGEAVFWEGELSKGLYIVERGSVKLFKSSLQGRELVLQVFGEGESFNEVPVFDRETNPVNVAALEESTIWIVDAAAIRACLDKYPEVAKDIILNLSKNLRMLVEKVEELSFFQVTNRLARLLARLPDEQLMGQTDIRLTRDELAARLGTVREVVVRSLRELERSGAIQVSRKKIEIVDEARLQDWIETPTS
jgi:CRP/FNR family transcriptional regulator